MKRPLFFLALLLLTLGAWALSYQFGLHHLEATAQKNGADLLWLRDEFKISDATFQQIKTLQQDYDPICDELCHRIMESQTNLRGLISSHREITPEIKEALKNDSLLKQECQTAMLEHIYRISALLPVEDRKRYLELIEKQVLTPGCGMSSSCPMR